MKRQYHATGAVTTAVTMTAIKTCTILQEHLLIEFSLYPNPEAIERKEANLASRENELVRQKAEISKLNEERLQELERIAILATSLRIGSKPDKITASGVSTIISGTAFGFTGCRAWA